MSLRTRVLRIASELPKGSPVRRRLLAALIRSKAAAARVIDVDKLQGTPYQRAREALYQVAYRILEGEKPVWVVDDGGALETLRDLPSEVRQTVWGTFMDETEYAAEMEDFAKEERLRKDAERYARTRFRILKVKSPRTGRNGYKITW